MHKVLFFISVIFLSLSNANAGKTPISEEYDVVVVGGGLAGLTTTYELTKAGKKNIALFEGQDRLGGRAYTYHDGSGYRELGGQDIDAEEERKIQKLAKELECALINVPYSKSPVYFYGQEQKSYEELLEDTITILTKVEDYLLNTKLEEEKASLWDVLTRLFPEDEKMQNLALMFQGDSGLDPEQMHPNVLMWGTEEYKKAIQYLKRLTTPNSTEQNTAEVSDSTIEGGNKVLIDKLAQKIGKDRIRTQHVLTKVKRKIENDGRESFVLYFKTLEKTKFKVAAETIVMTLPFSVLRQDVILDSSLNLPELTKRAIQEIPYATYAKVTIPTNAFWGNPQENTFLFFDGKERIEVSDYSFNQDQPGITVYFSGKAGIDNFTDAYTVKQSVLKTLIDSFSQKIPNFEVDLTRPIISYAPTLDPFARGSWATMHYDTDPLFNPGSSYRNALVKYAAPSGSFYWAGEHTVNNFPGTMNGAVLSGKLVAKRMLKPEKCSIM